MGSLSLLQGIFPTQGSNPGFPHCGQILYQLNHNWPLNCVDFTFCLLSNYDCFQHFWVCLNLPPFHCYQCCLLDTDKTLHKQVFGSGKIFRTPSCWLLRGPMYANNIHSKGSRNGVFCWANRCNVYLLLWLRYCTCSLFADLSGISSVLLTLVSHYAHFN